MSYQSYRALLEKNWIIPSHSVSEAFIFFNHLNFRDLNWVWCVCVHAQVYIGCWRRVISNDSYSLLPLMNFNLFSFDLFQWMVWEFYPQQSLGYFLIFPVWLRRLIVFLFIHVPLLILFFCNFIFSN